MKMIDQKEQNNPESNKSWPKAAIIILNWNGWEDTIECLESLQKLDYPEYQTIVVDNGSTNDSLENIKNWCEGKIPHNMNLEKSSSDFKPLKYIEYKKSIAESGGKIEKERIIEKYPSSRKLIIIRSDNNYGFPGGNNIAIKYTLRKKYDYVWLLNNDTVIDKNALKEMVNIAESDEKIGMVGSKIINFDHSDLINVKKAIDNKNNHFNNKSIPVKWIEGSSLLAKKKTIEQIGLLDENYFLYGEDKDWCTQARQKGWKLVRALKSIIWHKWGASTKSGRIKKNFFGKKVIRIPWESYLIPGYYEARNGVYYTKKNLPQYFLLYLILRTSHLIAQVILYDDHKLARIRIILKGAWHGLLGKMGKTVEPVKAEK